MDFFSTDLGYLVIFGLLRDRWMTRREGKRSVENNFKNLKKGVLFEFFGSFETFSSVSFCHINNYTTDK